MHLTFSSKIIYICPILITYRRLKKKIVFMKFLESNLSVCFPGHADSNWSVGAVLEKRLNPMPFTIALSGIMNHAKNQFRVGVGLMVG